MNSKSLIILAFSIIFFSACNKENNLLEEMSENDLIALEGMEEAYEKAFFYNDSLGLCHDDPGNCDSATMLHYDELFHQYDKAFDFHHANYSHNNTEDDHHHEGINNIRHGWMMKDQHGVENEEVHGYEHNMENFNRLLELREMHEEIHPE